MNTTLPAVIEPEIIEPRSRALAVPPDPDDQLVSVWLGRHASRHTRRAYARHADRFRAFVAKPLAEGLYRDLQGPVANFVRRLGDGRVGVVFRLGSLREVRPRPGPFTAISKLCDRPTLRAGGHI